MEEVPIETFKGGSAIPITERKIVAVEKEMTLFNLPEVSEIKK